MRYDPFEFRRNMKPAQVVWRVLFLMVIIGTLVLDLTFWRP